MLSLPHDPIRHFPDGDTLCKHIASITGGKAVLFFSRGKDSIASFIQMRKHFDEIELIYRYMIPGLEFEEQSLAYYEKKFGLKIRRFPNPSLLHQLSGYMYQPPENLDIIHDKGLFPVTYEEIYLAALEDIGWKIDETMGGIGVRASDSINRYRTVKTHGSVNYNKNTFYPIFDWKAERLRNEIRAEGIKLPQDYSVWGRSFDGFDYRFIKGLKEHFPNDYDKVCEWFPLVDLEFKRYEAYAK